MVELKKFPPMLTNNFNDFTYLKSEHFTWFVKHDYDKVLFGRKVNPDNSPLKRFTDLIVFTFILQYIPPGSRILEVGGGNSRVLAFFKDRYECWNIDKMEGIGSGPRKKTPEQEGIRLIRDYAGNFHEALPENYFEFVFSISALEHVPQEDPALFDRIIDDMQRVQKPGSFSLHCLDIKLRRNKSKRIWVNRILYRLFERIDTVNDFIPLEQLENAGDIYVLAERFFNNSGWRKRTGCEYKDYGLLPTSYQVLWQK